MRREIVIKGKGLAGSSDLTLLATIKPGFVPALDAVTYKSRVKRLLKALHAGRASAHEYALIRPLSDAVERIDRIHSVRVMVVEGAERDQVLLSATFDGSWESYFRNLWQKTGRLLDAIYCNTEDYVSAWDHPYEAWLAWARRVQLETDFFYGLPTTTVDDARYLRDTERHLRRCAPLPAAAPADAAEKALLETMRYSLPSVESLARDWVVGKGQEDLLDGVPSDTGKAERELVRQGLQSLAGLYAMTDLYLPDTSDGPYLQRAAVEFLSELLVPSIRSELDDPTLRSRFDRQLAWLDAACAEPPPAIRLPVPPPTVEPVFDKADVQGGIVKPYVPATPEDPTQACVAAHGALLLLAFDSPAAAASFLQLALERVTTAEVTTVALGSTVCNVALTLEGLRQCGLDESQLGWFPDEFRYGMAARAGQIGDLRGNHPRRWARPLRHGGASPEDRVDLAAVHAVVQLRRHAPAAQTPPDLAADAPGHPLAEAIQQWLTRASGIQLLALETMRRDYTPKAPAAPAAQAPVPVQLESREHFGFVDEVSDPTIDPAAPDARINLVNLGEILLGYPNQSDAAPDFGGDADRARLLRNGSYLVVRKLRQYVDRLDGAVQAAASQAIDAETVYGKLVGRKRNGEPMITGYPGNNFTYGGDPGGAACPLHAHMRRANPRNLGPSDPPGQRRPTLVRRGMSYGPRWDPADPASAAAERGLVFMAYNTSIGEQFEVIQRWLAGGNSTGSTSNVSDPLIGVPENGRRRQFAFEHGGRPVQVPLDGSDTLLDDPAPFVRLEWGSYLFTPSVTALGWLRGRAAAAAVSIPWDEDDGERRLQALLALGDTVGAIAAWKAALEDIESVRTFVAASIWAAVRNRHGGLLRTAYGVLVADGDLVAAVLADKAGYSVCGYLERMRRSIGADHLGLDDTGTGCPYQQQSKAINDAIEALNPDLAFTTARIAANAKIDALIADAKQKSAEDPRYELSLDPREVIDEVLAKMCEAWFGLETTSGHFARGPMRWDWRSDEPPLYPGHFGAPSRYIFQPQPGEEVVRYGILHGTTARTAMAGFVDSHRPSNMRPAGPVGEAALGPLDAPVATDAAARALAGAVMGFVPTVDGALRRVLGEWTTDGTLWMQRALQGGQPFADRTAAADRLTAPMVAALQLRPMPEVVWRTAASNRVLVGTDRQPLELQPGDTVVLALVSALQQNLVDGASDLTPMFGGDRSLADHPTHACPGRNAGTAVMLGLLAALVERAEDMRPGPLAPSLVIEGPNS